VADAAGETQNVAFKTHARPATVAETSTGEFITNLFRGDAQACGKSFDNDRQGGAVAFASG
jgi:hypothetical protein